MDDYAAFLEQKRQNDTYAGHDPSFLPSFLYDFQLKLVEWAVRKGRGAIFADCGLGKTPMQLVWAENVIRKTNGRVLILTPLAVAAQTVKEAEKFDIQAAKVSDGACRSGITVANYERLHYFDPTQYAGVVADESSILKSFDGARRAEVTEFLRRVPYRLLCTATAAPNEYIELGTSSEALGYLGHMDMLSRFFKNDQGTSKPMRNVRAKAGVVTSDTGLWRLKGHAEEAFWQWVCSWSRSLRKPSDLGCADAEFALPPLHIHEHIIQAKTLAPGQLFALPAVGLKDQREERRRTIVERCEKAASLVADTGESAVVWCHLNDEGDRLADLIPDAAQVSGKDSDEKKEELFTAFSSGQLRVLVTKPKIGAWGLNWQHCHHVVFFPSHSYEQYYQGVRRCWRFGQKEPVTVDIVATEGEHAVIENLQRKARACDAMFSRLVEHMHHELTVARDTRFTQDMDVPLWL